MPKQVVEDRLDDELARVSHQTDLILDAVGEGIYGLDPAGRCTFVNPAAAKMLGYAAERLVGQPLHDLVHGKNLDGSAYLREECPVQATLQDGAVHRVAGEVYWRGDGTSFPVEYVSAPLRAAGVIAGAVVAFRDVSERYQAEAEQRRLLRRAEAAEARLRVLLETAPDAIVIAREDGRIVMVNRRAEQVFGYGPAELVGQPVEILVPARFRDAHRARFPGLPVSAGSSPVEAEVELCGRRKDGSEFPVELSLSWLELDGGLLITAILRDTTERRRVERALRENHAILRAVFDGTTDAIFVKDHAGRYQMINAAGARFLGKSADDIIGQDDSALFADGTGEAIMARDRAVMARGETLTYEEVGTAAGVTRTYLATKGVYRDERGNVAGLIGISRDITERKRAEEERLHLLQREQVAHAEAERLAAERAATLGKIADSVIIADPAGRVVFVNDAARQLFDLTGVAIPVEVAPGDGPGDLPVLYPLRRAALHGETVVGTQLALRRPSGKEVAIEASATPISSDDGTQLGAVLTLHDVTAHRELERQKDEFLANVSHDLRTPLTGIKASIGVVLANEPPDLPAPLHRLLTNIDLAADRMTALVADLLELTRLRAGRVPFRPAVRDLREIARNAARTIEPLAQERAQRLELDLPTKPVRAPVDADRLERALLNVLGNAQKYGPAGGTIRLRLERHSGEAIFAVADDGPGIAEADQEHLFERFFRSDSEATRHNQGSGLGLPIARAMVELHGGRIWVESAVGVGTTFRIAIPLPTR